MSDAHQSQPIPPAGGPATSAFVAGDAAAMPPWPPPGTEPPTPTPPPPGPLPGSGGPSAPPPPAGAPPLPLGDAGTGTGPPPAFGDDDDDGIRPPVWALALIPIVIVALLVFLLWRANQDDGGKAQTPTTAVTTAPETGTSDGGVTTGSDGPASSDGSATTGAGTSGPATTASGGSATTAGPGATTPDGSAVPTAPGGAATTAVPGTPGAPGGPATTAASTPPQTPAPTTPTARAFVVAQDMAAALADGDWSEVRRLSPTDQRTDAQFEHDYAGLEESTVVPARATPLSSGLIDLRLGLVAHEAPSTGAQTSLFCAHWIVDPQESTVQRLSAQRLRTEGGTIPAAQVASELQATCSTLPMR